VTDDGSRSVLIVVRHSPYGSSLAKASLDIALAMAAFEQRVDMLFIGDGVLQLCPNQDTQALGVKSISRQLASLPLYDISSIYVDESAATRYQLDLAQAPVPTQALDGPQMHQLMSGFDHLLGL
jgi:tRNA 2-thiouridine synthesizing protein C